MRNPTWLTAYSVAQLAAFMAVEKEFGGFWMRFLFASFIALLALAFWRGLEYGKARILRSWERYRARRRAIDEATP